MAEFVVESGGVCFLCFEHIPAYFPPCKFEPESYPTPLYSLQTLSSYLKLNTRKAFEPPHQFRNKSKVKVELCEGCVSLTEKFSKLCQQLEKIEMEVSSHLNLIYGKLLESSKRGDGTMGMYNGNGKFPLRNQKIVERLRTQAIKKCSRRLKSTLPRVKVQKLTKTEEEAVRNQMKKAQLLLWNNAMSTKTTDKDSVISEHLLDPDIDIGHVKIERSCLYATPSNVLEDDLGDNDETIFNDFLSDIIANEDIKIAPKKSISTNRKLRLTSGATKKGRKMSTKDPVSQQHKCNLCPERFPNRSQLTSHYRKCTYKCSMCGGTVEFSKKHTCPLVRQQKSSSTSSSKSRRRIRDNLPCNVCGKQFNSYSSRSRHFRIVHIGIQFKCQFCSKEFVERYGLQRHIQEGSCYLDDAVRHICCCRYCKKGFCRMENFEKHLKAHHLSKWKHKYVTCVGRNFR